jgi:hypothetical protein
VRPKLLNGTCRTISPRRSNWHLFTGIPREFLQCLRESLAFRLWRRHAFENVNPIAILFMKLCGNLLHQ